MRKKVAGIPIYLFALAFAICLVAILLGSFYDLEISQGFVITENVFGKVVALAGKYPGYALLALSGLLFFLSRKEKKGTFNVILSWGFLIALGLGAGALYGIDDIDELLDDKVISALIGVVALAPAELLFYFLFRKADHAEAFNASMAFLFIGVLTIGVSYLLKTAALRPRYSWLFETDNLTLYQDWFSFSSAAREANPAFPDSDFASWPSAHTALASVTVAMVLFPRLNSKLAGKQIVFLLASFLWTALVAVGRVSDGSHFISDVGWGALIGLLLSFLVLFVIYPSPKALVEQPVSPTTSPLKNVKNKKKTKDNDLEIDI